MYLQNFLKVIFLGPKASTFLKFDRNYISSSKKAVEFIFSITEYVGPLDGPVRICTSYLFH